MTFKFLRGDVRPNLPGFGKQTDSSSNARTVGMFVAIILIVAAGYLAILDQVSRPKDDVAQELLPTTMINIDGRSMLVELATDPASQGRGLSFRESLAPDRGMLFVFPTAMPQRFWMYGMKFPLDIIFITDDHVVFIDRNVPAPQGGIPAVVEPEPMADAVLEVNAGVADAWGINVGSTVEISR